MKITRVSATVCRWIARIVGALLVVVIVIIAVGEKMPVGDMLTHPKFTFEMLGGVGIFLVVAGLLSGWRWELVGGMLSLVGVCSIFVSMKITGYGRITWFLAALAAPGVLFITSHLLRSYASRHTKTPAGSTA
jgi:hypothetical protein